MALSPAASGWFHSELSVSAPLTIRASSSSAGSRSSRYLRTIASNEHSLPWCPSSTPLTSYGIACSRCATAMTWSTGTNRNTASGSTNFLMSHGQTTRSTLTRSRVIHFMSCPLVRSRAYGGSWTHAGKGKNADDRGDRHQHRLRQLLHLPEQSDRDQRHQGCRQVDDRSLRENDDCAGDGADRRGGDSVDERNQRRTLAVFLEVGRGKDGKQVTGQERAQRGDHRAGHAGNQITDETYGNHDRPGRDHRHRYCVDELALAQPLIIMHDPSVEEGNDCETAAENERAGLGEEGAELRKQRPIDPGRDCAYRCPMRGEHGEHRHGMVSKPAFRGRPHQPYQHPGAQEQPDTLRLR